MRESFGRSPLARRPQGRHFSVTPAANRLGLSLSGVWLMSPVVPQVVEPPSLRVPSPYVWHRTSSLRGPGTRQDAMGASRLTVVTNSPRSRALGFGPSSPGRQVGWQDEVEKASGLATHLGLPGLGNVLAMSPMLYVQLRLGEVTVPA